MRNLEFRRSPTLPPIGHRFPACIPALRATTNTSATERSACLPASTYCSKETRAWIAEQPTGRFEFTFTPKHGSWLNLIEGFFSKLARSVLRHIRVSSKQELKERLLSAIKYFNDNPVVHTWTYKLEKAA